MSQVMPTLDQVDSQRLREGYIDFNDFLSIDEKYLNQEDKYLSIIWRRII